MALTDRPGGAQQNQLVSDLGDGSTLEYETMGGGSTPKFLAAAAGLTVIKATPGRLMRIICTAAGTASTTFFDNASAASGNVLYKTKAAPALGDIYDVQVAAQNGITVDQPASTGAFTITFH